MADNNELERRLLAAIQYKGPVKCIGCEDDRPPAETLPQPGWGMCKPHIVEWLTDMLDKGMSEEAALAYLRLMTGGKYIEFIPDSLEDN
jgi:hypothetical protein